MNRKNCGFSSQWGKIVLDKVIEVGKISQVNDQHNSLLVNLKARKDLYESPTTLVGITALKTLRDLRNAFCVRIKSTLSKFLCIYIGSVKHRVV